MNSYTKTKIDGDKYIITQVQETVLHNIQIEKVEGDAILTHIGAYKRIKFLYNNEIFISEPGNYLALNESKSKCICIDNISFDKDIESNWTNYIYQRNTKSYWIEATDSEQIDLKNECELNSLENQTYEG